MSGGVSGEAEASNGHVGSAGTLWLKGSPDFPCVRDTGFAHDSSAHATVGGRQPNANTLRLEPSAATTPGVLQRLKQRKIVQWVLGYLAIGWMILQLTDVLASVWGVSLVAQRVISLTVGLGVFPALIVAWYHGERGRQRICCTEVALAGLAIAAAVVAIWQVCLS